ncbi:MAG TPA: protein kinase family protein [Blastococcus sp.]|nr:protein kinase family protein [Blastococcus sp.]
MTSTTTGLPDRYRPIDQVGPDEPTPTGVIQCWRAKDRVLNRDVAIRVHTPAGPAAHGWISRALTAGGLATPALAMVYDASEGTGDPQAPGGAAYVVNEWIDGETLAERLTRGPMPDREVRTVLRRLAEGVAEAHRVGLAVGGLTPENVVLRPNGLVGLRAVPAATGTIEGDIVALGALLEACLTGLAPGGARQLTGPSDLVALVRRARSTDPGQGLSSVAAMAALLAERPRTGPGGAGAVQHRTEPQRDDTDSGWLRRLRERRPDAAEVPMSSPAVDLVDEADAVRLDRQTMPPVPAARPVTRSGSPLPPAALGGDTIDAGSVAPPAGAYAAPPVSAARHDAPETRSWEATGENFLADGGYDGPVTGETDIDEDGARRHKLVVIGLPLLALVVVIALAWWVGSTLLHVTSSVDTLHGSTPSAIAPATTSGAARGAGAGAGAGASIPIVSADVFDPLGDGQPENNKDVPKAYDGDPSTAWSTLEYRKSPKFGNLKDGVGIVLDLGSSRSLKGVTLTTTTPGATVEVRTADQPAANLDGYKAAAAGKLDATTDMTFAKPVKARFVLVWLTSLVPSANGFSADIAEVAVHPAG